MQISSRFTIAVHMLTCMETFKEEYKITSDFLAASINVNPVIIRRILSQLKDAGLIEVKRGTGGAAVIKPLEVHRGEHAVSFSRESQSGLSGRKEYSQYSGR